MLGLKQVSRNSVLIYGHDKSLLQRRENILAEDGIAALPTQDLAAVISHIAHGGTSVLILCHSIPGWARDHLLRVAHELRPEMKTLVLDASSWPCEAGTHHFDGSTERAHAFTVTVHQLLGY